MSRYKGIPQGFLKEMSLPINPLPREFFIQFNFKIMLLLFFYRTNDQTGATQICIPVNKDDLEINTMLRIEKAAADGYVGRKINDPI